MRSWFSRKARPTADPAPVDAYKEGRVDERERLARNDGQGSRASRGEIDAAYDRGRADEARRRRGHPFITLVLVILSLGAVAMIYLAVKTGSFGAAGAQVDAVLASGAQRAASPVTGAENKAGNALENAGETLKDRAASNPS